MIEANEVKIKDSYFLVTGGAGFIGSNLCEKLIEKGTKVRCLDDLSTGKMENIEHLIGEKNFEFIHASITDYTACLAATAGIDYVLHQAALGSVPRSMKNPLLYEKVNVQGTLNMLEASSKQQVKKFVYASSSSVYGDSQTLPKKEGDEGIVLSPYALTKKTNELYGKLYSDIYELPTVGLRYFNVFGRRQNPNGQYAAVIPKFIEAFLRKEAPTINGDGEHSRDFTYIDNVVTANILAAVSSTAVTGRAYNIAASGQVTLNQLCKLLQTKLDCEDVPINYGLDRPGDIKHSFANIELAEKDLGYQPKISFESGIEEALKWYRGIKNC
ncbi:SDR family oxidoreductase [Enterococcus raffinosus]|uniref:SDR family oxidoreductase n=1 Tax=Enterococcus raffinosus TaxID=71452 RepID=A0AAW8TA05_9ENTE|nr:SDR family oxidoreductase [Enterococcus raffinosus]MDT2522030.1 SDR family oxidoreductase [Enterococcus raffinosus]MDT2528374.1 SDR family oxidoreductase [Enterococcus raffinosus]MDT2533160.1 SDR family oxidoreductase [Enterococcus raffinosus]MDT2543600.1 SDR family oxidoreductase [Enterococcus raffinosus]MDT2553714.1 SDR family oxidoreductase [Enterococcus raffinosus]